MSMAPKTKGLKTEDPTPNTSLRRYNIAVLTPKSQQEVDHRHRRHAVYASESTGLLLIAFMLLVLTLIRYWHEIHWSFR